MDTTLPPIEHTPSVHTLRRNYQQSLNLKKLKHLSKRLDDQELAIIQPGTEWSL